MEYVTAYANEKCITEKHITKIQKKDYQDQSGVQQPGYTVQWNIYNVAIAALIEFGWKMKHPEIDRLKKQTKFRRASFDKTPEVQQLLAMMYWDQNNRHFKQFCLNKILKVRANTTIEKLFKEANAMKIEQERLFTATNTGPASQIQQWYRRHTRKYPIYKTLPQLIAQADFDASIYIRRPKYLLKIQEDIMRRVAPPRGLSENQID